MADVDAGGDAGRLSIGPLDRRDERFDRRGPHQGHGTPPESGPGHPCTVTGRVLLGAGHHRVQLRAGDFEVVAQAGVAGVHQASQLEGVPGLHRGDGLERAGVFGDHVPGAAADHLIQAVGAGLELSRVHVPQGRHTEEASCGLALHPPFVVGRIRQPPPGSRIQHHDGGPWWQRHRCRLQGATIDQQRVVGLAGGGDHLVHNAAVDAHPFVFRLLPQPGHLDRLPRQAGHGSEGPGRGHLQRGRRRQPRPGRHIPDQRPVPARQRMAGALHSPGDPLQIFDPSAVNALQAVQIERRRLVKIQRVYPHDPVGAGTESDPNRPVDCHWQHEAIVVIRVFPDQIHPAGGAHDIARGRAKEALKPSIDVFL